MKRRILVQKAATVTIPKWTQRGSVC